MAAFNPPEHKPYVCVLAMAKDKEDKRPGAKTTWRP